MKTNFETAEEQRFLHSLYWYGIRATEIVFTCTPMWELSIYMKKMLDYRKQCFEYLGEDDPNEHAIDSLNKCLAEKEKNNESK